MTAGSRAAWARRRPPWLLAIALLAIPGAASGILLSLARPDRPARPPLGLPAVRWPAGNPYSTEKAGLGRLLFFDRRLSSDGSIACASCHQPQRAFTDGAALPTGILDQKGTRSAPALFNRIYGRRHLWDGRALSVEETAKNAIANPREMTTEKDATAAHVACVGRLRAVAGYRRAFRNVFGSEAFTIDQVAAAIATFVRTIVSGDSPFDRYRAGERTAMTPAQVRGMDLFFNRLSCANCHSGPNLSDELFWSSGVGMDRRRPDLGRYVITGQMHDHGAFKTPTLREIEHTAPYMHDGSIASLEKVVEHYEKGGIAGAQVDDRVMQEKLTKEVRADLVAFLKALSGRGWRHLGPPASLPN